MTDIESWLNQIAAESSQSAGLDEQEKLLFNEDNSFISCIKFDSIPILPPLLNEEKRKEMQKYKKEAMKRETCRNKLSQTRESPCISSSIEAKKTKQEAKKASKCLEAKFTAVLVQNEKPGENQTSLQDYTNKLNRLIFKNKIGNVFLNAEEEYKLNLLFSSIGDFPLLDASLPTEMNGIPLTSLTEQQISHTLAKLSETLLTNDDACLSLSKLDPAGSSEKTAKTCRNRQKISNRNQEKDYVKYRGKTSNDANRQDLKTRDEVKNRKKSTGNKMEVKGESNSINVNAVGKVTSIKQRRPSFDSEKAHQTQIGSCNGKLAKNNFYLIVQEKNGFSDTKSKKSNNMKVIDSETAVDSSEDGQINSSTYRLQSPCQKHSNSESEETRKDSQYKKRNNSSEHNTQLALEIEADDAFRNIKLEQKFQAMSEEQMNALVDPSLFDMETSFESLSDDSNKNYQPLLRCNEQNQTNLNKIFKRKTNLPCKSAKEKKVEGNLEHVVDDSKEHATKALDDKIPAKNCVASESPKSKKTAATPNQNPPDSPGQGKIFRREHIRRGSYTVLVPSPALLLSESQKKSSPDPSSCIVKSVRRVLDYQEICQTKTGPDSETLSPENTDADSKSFLRSKDWSHLTNKLHEFLEKQTTVVNPKSKAKSPPSNRSGAELLRLSELNNKTSQKLKSERKKKAEKNCAASAPRKSEFRAEPEKNSHLLARRNSSEQSRIPFTYVRSPGIDYDQSDMLSQSDDMAFLPVSPKQLFTTIDSTPKLHRTALHKHHPLKVKNARVAIPKKAEDLEMKPKFDCISAVVKGYLTRQLLKTHKVQHLTKIIKDTQQLVEEFTTESPSKEEFTLKERDFISRIIAQWQAALLDIHEIFFVIPVERRMALIANYVQLQRNKKLMNKPIQIHSKSSYGSRSGNTKSAAAKPKISGTSKALKKRTEEVVPNQSARLNRKAYDSADGYMVTNAEKREALTRRTSRTSTDQVRKYEPSQVTMKRTVAAKDKNSKKNSSKPWR